MSYVTALYHIVFCTKGRQMTISDNYREDVYRFIWSIVKDNGCRLLRIGGIANHIHMLVDLNATVALSDLIRTIKACTSGWMRNDPRFAQFVGWAREYYACSVSPEASDAVVNYIKSQQAHHAVEDFDKELDKLLRECGMRVVDNAMI